MNDYDRIVVLPLGRQHILDEHGVENVDRAGVPGLRRVSDEPRAEVPQNKLTGFAAGKCRRCDVEQCDTEDHFPV